MLSFSLFRRRRLRFASSSLPLPLVLFTVLLLVVLLQPIPSTTAAAASSSGGNNNNNNNLPFVLGVRDSFMIAHSFHNNPNFGPAGGLHGATYTCDIEFSSNELDPDNNWVIDIGLALTLLGEVLAKYNYQNLDDIFGPTTLTTTEFMARQIHQDLCQKLLQACSSSSNDDSGNNKQFNGNLCVKLWESHKAWASYTGKVQ